MAESEVMKPLKPIPHEKPREGRKHFVIAALLVLVAAAFWYNVHSFLVSGLQFNPGRLTQLGGTLLLFGIMNGLVGVVGFTFRDILTRLIIYFFACATHFIFFGISFYSVVTIALLWLVWMRYGRNTGWEEKERIHFHSVKILTHTLGTLVVLSLIALSFSYYGIVVQDTTRSGVLIDHVSDAATHAAVSTLSATVHEFNPDMTLDDFLNQYAGEHITELFPEGLLPENIVVFLNQRDSAEGQDLPPLPEATLTEFRQELLLQFDITATGSDSIRSVIAEIVRKRLRDSIGPYEQYLPPVLALSLFAGLTAFSLLYFWTSVVMGWVLIRILFWVKLLRIRQQTTPVEQLIVE